MKIKKIKISKRAATIIAAALVFITACVATVAYQTNITDDVVNDITFQKLNASIEETVDGDTKKEIVVVADDDNSDKVYVRVALIANWVNVDNPDVVYIDPVPDLTEYINTDKWTLTEVSNGGSSGHTNAYYVYNEPLSPGESTDNLLKKELVLSSDGEKKLEVTVLMQAADKETFEGSVMQ